MQRVLILGGAGMLGHRLWLNYRKRFDTYVTFRQLPGYDKLRDIYDPARVINWVSATELDGLVNSIGLTRPEFVINCIGIVKQDKAAKDALQSISVNALFPHRLAQLCRAAGARLIHISTDCVFTGRKGNYAEGDVPDAEDLYGRTKLLGEVTGENCLTIRTSIIGRELSGSHGLIEWFLGQRGKRVKGFRRAVFSGFTTAALAGILARIIVDYPELNGLRHVAAEPINKFDLLSLTREIYGLDIDIEPDDDFVCDRSLDGTRFRAETGLTAPTWVEMIKEMAEDATPYDEIRRNHAGR